MNALSDNSGLHARHHGELAAYADQSAASHETTGNEGYQDQAQYSQQVQHSRHAQQVWQYGAMTGLVAMTAWLAVCGLLRLFLLLPWPKANVPGAYLFGFKQNVGNYIAANGRSVDNLLFRTSSVFERPGLLPQYLKAMARNEHIKEFRIVELDSPPPQVQLSHAVVKSRNIYEDSAGESQRLSGSGAPHHLFSRTGH